jgi:glycosyltransferase involved in cell wall biosynthesis
MDSGKSKKKKILFISDITFVHTIGGTEVATARLLNGLAEDGTYEIYLFSGAPRDGKRGIEPDSRIHITEFPLYPAPGDKGFNNFVIANPFQISKLIKKIAPDIIHVHNPSIFSLMSIRVARRYNIPLVYTNHIFAEHFVPFVKTWKQKQSRKIADWFFQKYMGLFDGIVYPSQIQRETILSKYHLKNTSVVISNGFLSFGEDMEGKKPE